MAWSIDDAEISAEQPVTQSLMTRLRDGGIETAVQMMARQNAAPLGWTKVTTDVDDRAIRLFSGTPSDGGSLNFSTVFNRTLTDNFTLAKSDIPNYNLPDSLSITGSQAGGLARNLSINDQRRTNNQGEQDVKVAWQDTTLGIGGVVNSGGSNSAHRHGMDIRVQYIGMCLFEKT